MLASRKMVEVETGMLDASRQNDQGVFAPPDEDFAYEMKVATTTQTNVSDVLIIVSWGPAESERVELSRLIHTALRPK
jgi:hypothetical protein